MKDQSYYREKYVRNLPSKFCPGCGCGIVMNAFVWAVDELGIPKKDIVLTSGIGCSAWIPSPHLRFDSIHTPHGRAIPVAVGVKLFRPELTVATISGDGDLAGIGLGHLIHAAARNYDITVVMVNNGIYAMTGGQLAPTTPKGLRTPTTPDGNPYRPLDVSQLVATAGASFVARWTTFHFRLLVKSMVEALETKGFSFVEVLSQCPTYMGRRMNLTPYGLMRAIAERTSLKGEEGKTRIGVLKG
ncbi:MAG: 2-oxoacid:ferredoxin oxidoreductase subunit beta [Thermoplasmata archaeon]|nr:2-oxoacid:ferredoxin oxidoreductase subunit beta [Thermoplasmata archaeon]